jgi:hypothetical protein
VPSASKMMSEAGRKTDFSKINSDDCMNKVIGMRKTIKITDKKRSVNSDAHIFNEEINTVEPSKTTFGIFNQKRLTTNTNMMKSSESNLMRLHPRKKTKEN